MTHTTLSASPSVSVGQEVDRSAAGEAALDDAAISDAVIDAATMDAATLSGMQSEMLRVGVAAAHREHPPGDDRQGTPASRWWEAILSSGREGEW